MRISDNDQRPVLNLGKVLANDVTWAPRWRWPATSQIRRDRKHSRPSGTYKTHSGNLPQDRDELPVLRTQNPKNTQSTNLLHAKV